MKAPGSDGVIRAIIDCADGGCLVTLGAPGLAIDHRGAAWIDPVALDDTLAMLVGLKTALFVLLARDIDYPEGYRLMLRRCVRQAGMGFIALPIDDFSPPGIPWMRAWRRMVKPVEAVLSSGGAVALCCSYGAGRSGMVAAYILNRKGLSVEESLARVRTEFAESVESPLQEAWLYSCDSRATPAKVGTGFASGIAAK